MNTWRLFGQNNAIDLDGYRFACKHLKDKQIVIADDNGGILKWLQFSLEDYGAIVHVFEHGQEAIDFVSVKQKAGSAIDVLLLDLIMNEVGGIEIAKHCHKIAPEALAVFITGCSKDSTEWAEAIQLGTVLQKPVGIENVLKVILDNVVKKNNNKKEKKHNASAVRSI